MSFANSELLPPIGGYFRPLVGRDPYNKKNVDDSLTKTIQAANVLEQHLLVNTFLVGERLTLADLFVAGIASRGFEFMFDKKFRSINTNLTRWFETITNQPIYTAIVEKAKMCDEILKNVPPKSDGSKKEKKEAPKKEAAAKAQVAAPASAAAEEDEPAPPPKPKHPLEALPKPTLVLDDWKRKYSNEETRKVALPWFWKNYKPEEYSLWKVDYKHNGDLRETFKTSNQISKFSLVQFLAIPRFPSSPLYRFTGSNNIDACKRACSPLS